MTGLSFPQRRLWYLYQLDGPSPRYNVPIVLRFRGSLDTSAMATALDDVVARHLVLRSVIVADRDGEPHLHVLDPDDKRVPYLRVREGSEESVAAAATAAASRPFRLDEDVPWHATLHRLSPQDHLLVFVGHHSILDDWSGTVLVDDWAACYGARSRGLDPALPSLPVDYLDFSAWQHGLVAGEDDASRDRVEEQLRFWRTELEDAPSSLGLPVVAERSEAAAEEEPDEGLITVPLRLEAPTHAAIAATARGARTTPFVVLVSAVAIALGRTAGTTDVVLGYASSGRTDVALEHLLGFFANTLPLRVALMGNPRLYDVVEQVRRRVSAADRHQDVPFEWVVEELGLAGMDHSPLFQVMLTHDARPVGGRAFGGAEAVREPLSAPQPKFDLAFTFVELHDGAGPAGVELTVEADGSIFRRSAVKGLVQRTSNVVEDISHSPERRLGDVEVLTESERRRLLIDWCDLTEHLEALRSGTDPSRWTDVSSETTR